MSLNDGAQRSYQRLECFFKRHFCEEICDALRIVEPCIVVGQNYDHAFKFVVLTDDVLYIIANPPKNENDVELSIDLQFITDINQVHDIPDFLSGDLKNNAQHLIISWSKPKHNTPTNIRPSVRPSRRSPKVEDRRELQSKNSSSKRDLKSSGIRFNLDDSSCSRLSQPVSLAASIPLNLSSSTDHLKNGAKHSEANRSKSPSFRRPLPPPPPGTETTNASNVRNPKKSGRQRRIQSERKFEDNADDFGLGSSMTHCASDSQLSSRATTTEHRLNVPPGNYNIDGQSSQHLTAESRITPTSSAKINQSTSPNLNRSFSERFGSLFGKTSGKNSPSDPSRTWPSAASSGRGNSDRNFRDRSRSIEEDPLEEANEEFSIDVYLINGESNFLPLLKCTNISSILRNTEEMETPREKFGTVFSSRVLEEFYQLKNDLLKCSNIEQAFILTRELLAGSKGNVHLKNLFWKTPDLVHYYVNTLNAYLIEQDKIVVHGDRADELDYMLVIADLIMTMLFNTEICPSRNKVMFGQRGALVCKLVKLLLIKPDLPNRRAVEALSPAAALLLAGVDKQDLESEKEKELAHLLREWTDACSCLIHELIRATEQSKWTYRDGKGISLRLLTDIVESHTNIEQYLSEIIDGIMNRLLHRRAVLKFSAAVLLYRQFSLLRFIFDNSPTLLRYVADHYYEEFRYYIGSPNATSRIPDCPISSNLLQLISDVTSIVVHKH